MAYDDLREWIKALDKTGELKRVRHEVDPLLEITEITDRASKAGKKGGLKGYESGGPALLFENVKGYPGTSVLMNQFGSKRRMKLALNVDSLDEIAQRIRALLEVKSPEGFLEKLKMLPMLAEVGKFLPEDGGSQRCALQAGNPARKLQCARSSRAAMLAARRRPLRHAALRRHTRSEDRQTQCRHVPDAGLRRTDYRNALAAPKERRRASARASARSFRSTAAEHVHAMAETAGGTTRIALGNLKDNRLEVAVAIGTDPATTFAAIVPAPPDVEEYLIAGFLRQKPVELVKCETVDLEVPAHAEIVLEGYVKLDELRSEGPFGDHTGFYTMEEEYPVFHITCITHRKDPIYASTIVGKPPMEDAWMGKAVERIFLPLMRLTLPEIVDINLPVEGVFHNLMIVSVKKSYAGQARKVMNGIWSMGQAMFTKCVIVVDEDCDVQDLAEVTLRVANNIDPERDIQFTLGPVDSLDHSSRLPNYGSKMGIDATRKWAAEGFTRPWPPMIEMDAATKSRVDEIWKKLGIEE